MVRRLAVLSGLVAVATAFAAPWAPNPAAAGVEPAARRATRTIEVTLSCATQSGSVNDSSLHAQRGDTIVFALTPESDVRDFKVLPKPRVGIFPGRWLFQSREHVGAPGRPAVGNDMKPDAQGTYSYKVIGTCEGGPPAKIDPDIIIDL